jgi:hypothetical protein
MGGYDFREGQVANTAMQGRAVIGGLDDQKIADHEMKRPQDV